MSNKTTGELISSLRHEKGFTQKELAEKARQAEILRTKREEERAKTQTKTPKIESESNTANDSPIIDLDFSNVDDVRKAFIASEIFNKKYC